MSNNNGYTLGWDELAAVTSEQWEYLLQRVRTPTPSPQPTEARSESPPDAEQTPHGSDTRYYVNSSDTGKC